MTNKKIEESYQVTQQTGSYKEALMYYYGMNRELAVTIYRWELRHKNRDRRFFVISTDPREIMQENWKRFHIVSEDKTTIYNKKVIANQLAMAFL